DLYSRRIILTLTTIAIAIFGFFYATLLTSGLTDAAPHALPARVIRRHLKSLGFPSLREACRGVDRVLDRNRIVTDSLLTLWLRAEE
ncbi:hypothetical protein AB9F43_32975, partial [Rhizobium leguminosarum]|uniref:hypothetical protein n=1 Tax=Rhizobium leguminosarum TaxID=384 RepID=UPI003F9DE363